METATACKAETFEERLRREHRERRSAWFRPTAKPEAAPKQEVEAAPAAQPPAAPRQAPPEQHGEPIQIATKPIVEADAMNAADARPSIETIQWVCAREYGISRNELLSARRVKSVVEPRQIAIYFAQDFTLLSYPAIARQFADRDHTTIMHAAKKIARKVAREPWFADRIAKLKEKIEQECRPAIDAGGGEGGSEA